MALRGECRRCHTPIAVRYRLVELLVAALFEAVGQRVGWRWDRPAVLLFVAGLVVLALVDADHLLLGRRLVYPLTAWSVVGYFSTQGSPINGTDWP
jgi:leader peptidase (prepilin peptidase)/N-methyltransferase